MRRALLLGLALLQAGCFRYHYKNPAAPAGPTPNDGQWHHDFIYFVELEHVNLARQCPQGWAQVDHQIGIYQTLAVLGGSAVLAALGGIGSLVGVIWQPSEVKVTCADPNAATPTVPRPPPPPTAPPPSVPTS